MKITESQLRRIIRESLEEISDKTINNAYRKGCYHAPGKRDIEHAIKEIEEALSYYAECSTIEGKYGQTYNQNSQAYKLLDALEKIKEFFVRKEKQQFYFRDAKEDMYDKYGAIIADLEKRYGTQYLIDAPWEELKQKLTPEEYYAIENYF